MFFFAFIANVGWPLLVISGAATKIGLNIGQTDLTDKVKSCKINKIMRWVGEDAAEKMGIKYSVDLESIDFTKFSVC